MHVPLCVQDPKTVSEVLDQSLHLIPDHVLDAPPVQAPLDALPPFPMPSLEWPAPAMRAGNNQTPVGEAQRVAALAEAAQAEEEEEEAQAGGVREEGGGVSACALEAALEEQLQPEVAVAGVGKQ